MVPIAVIVGMERQSMGKVTNSFGCEGAFIGFGTGGDRLGCGGLVVAGGEQKLGDEGGNSTVIRVSQSRSTDRRAARMIRSFLHSLLVAAQSGDEIRAAQDRQQRIGKRTNQFDCEGVPPWCRLP